MMTPQRGVQYCLPETWRRRWGLQPPPQGPPPLTAPSHQQSFQQQAVLKGMRSNCSSQPSAHDVLRCKVELLE